MAGCSYGLDSYCLGSSPIDLMAEFGLRRRLVLLRSVSAGALEHPMTTQTHFGSPFCDY